MEVKTIDTKENKRVVTVEWFQFANNIYILEKGEGSPQVVEEVKRNENQKHQKIGGDVVDLGFHNGKYVFCKNKNSEEPQKYVSVESLTVGFGICQKIPHRFSCIISKEIILKMILHEKVAIKIIDLFEPNENYYFEVLDKIYLFFGIGTELNVNMTLKRKPHDQFVKKVRLNPTVSKNNHDIDFGWHPLGYPNHIGFIDKTLVLFKEKTNTPQFCVTVDTLDLINGVPISLDESNSWALISKIPRNTLVPDVEAAKNKLNYFCSPAARKLII